MHGQTPPSSMHMLSAALPVHNRVPASPRCRATHPAGIKDLRHRYDIDVLDVATGRAHSASSESKPPTRWAGNRTRWKLDAHYAAHDSPDLYAQRTPSSCRSTTKDLPVSRPAAEIQPEHAENAVVSHALQQEQDPGNVGRRTGQQRVGSATQAAGQIVQQPVSNAYASHILCGHIATAVTADSSADVLKKRSSTNVTSSATTLQTLAHWRVRSRQVLLRFETSSWGRLRLRPGRALQRRGPRWRRSQCEPPGSMP
jgi:hypothetical protein